MLFEDAKTHTHCVCVGFFCLLLMCYILYGKDVIFLNHNSTFEKINLIIQRKRKKLPNTNYSTNTMLFTKK